MIKWEYISYTSYSIDSRKSFDNAWGRDGELNKFGQLGWELITVITTGNGLEFLFKRPAIEGRVLDS